MVEIKEGGIYRTSRNRKVGPMKRYHERTDCGMAFIVALGDGRGWTADGIGLANATGEDIVSERLDDVGFADGYPDFAEVEGAPDQRLQLEAGKIYLDSNGYVHGPMHVFDAVPGDERRIAYAGNRGWYEDGEPKNPHLGDGALVAEWTSPVPKIAIEENERLRQEVQNLQARVGIFNGLTRSDANHLAMRLGVEKVGQNRHRSTVFHECLQAVDRLKHDVEMHRDAAINAIADMKQAERRLDTLCVPHSSYFDGSVAAVFVPKAKLNEFSASCSDLACWMRGFVTALPPDDRLTFAPMGQYVVTELNILLKAALDRVEAAEKKS
ncbi:hypothetical protein [Mangrovibrevibacter kandeliae]|uniref:hypothetical protein n=1 Tax=Mangrovibrevibacter kandeliae TaxID=2968473 RepID=UPI0021191645|nr:hypothetical protein [Aurantimonas sp. CSK15Z-1]MCQ8781666.1 hypothetical protein [Aurantimonas sp. CSK15Z-1]